MLSCYECIALLVPPWPSGCWFTSLARPPNPSFLQMARCTTACLVQTQVTSPLNIETPSPAVPSPG
jgi:hypothetical protein